MSWTREGRERQRFLWWTLCSLPKELLLLCFFFLPDLKSLKVSSLWTFSNNSCGLRRKTKAVMLLGPFWLVQRNLDWFQAEQLISIKGSFQSGPFLGLSVTGALAMCSEPETPNKLALTCLSAWAGTQMLSSSICSEIQAGHWVVVQAEQVWKVPLGFQNVYCSLVYSMETIQHSASMLAVSRAPNKCCYYCSVQSLSCVRLFGTPWTVARQASLSITNSRSPPKPMSIESMMPSYHLILCCPLLLLPSIFPSIRVFSNESALYSRWPKYWSFSLNISLSNEYPGLISFRMDWLGFLAVQGTQESSPTPQFKSINSSALSFLYSPTLTSIHDHWKNHSLD